MDHTNCTCMVILRDFPEVWVGNQIPLVFTTGNNQQLEVVLLGDFLLIKLNNCDNISGTFYRHPASKSKIAMSCQNKC